MRRMVLECKGLLRAAVFLTFKYGLSEHMLIAKFHILRILSFFLFLTIHSLFSTCMKHSHISLFSSSKT